MVKVLSALLVLGSLATGAMYAHIIRGIAAEKRGGGAPASVARVAAAVLPGPARQPDRIRAEAGRPPLHDRHPAPADRTLVAQAIARAERLAVPKQVHGVFVYFVEPGDWVEEISRRFGVPVEVILDIHRMDRDAVLHPGEMFYLPIIEYTPRVGLASWYGPGFDHRPGANGAVYHQEQVSAAALHYPFDLPLEIVRSDNRSRVTVQVQDRGPYYPGRIVDLSRGAARALASVHDGVVEVTVKPINNHLAVIDRYLAGRSPVAMRGI